LSVDPNSSIPQPAKWDKFLGYEKRWKKGGPGTIAYSVSGDFLDVILVPPLSNNGEPEFCSQTCTSS